MQCFTGIRMIEVNSHLVVRYLAHLRLDDLSVHGVHRHDSTYIHTLGIELAVAVEEHGLRQVHQTLLQVLAVGLLRLQHEVERVTYLLTRHGCFERRKHHLLALTPYQRSLLRRLLHQFFFSILISNIQLVRC